MGENRSYVKRRRVPRRVFRRNVGLLVSGQYSINQALQIGEGGMMVYSQIPLKEGQKLVVAFGLPGMAHIVVRATVRYIVSGEADVPTSYGVQFDEIDFNAKRLIRNYVASKGAKESESSAA